MKAQTLQPLLAATIETEEQLAALPYPLLATPKLDGVRTLIMLGKGPVSRTFKPVPNEHMRDMLKTLPTGLDGEIMIPGARFEDISGAWRRSTGEPNFRYAVFDLMAEGAYFWRIHKLRGMELPPWCDKILPREMRSPSDVLYFEEEVLSEGYEGVMLRIPGGAYKFGRSTLKEAILLKFKRFLETEATVVGFEERRHNENALEQDAFGHAKRAQHAEHQRAAGDLGALVCLGTGPFAGIEFRIGTGFSASQRQEIWANRSSLIGAVVNFSYQPVGVKEGPRFPSFRGFRADLPSLESKVK